MTGTETERAIRPPASGLRNSLHAEIDLAVQRITLVRELFGVEPAVGSLLVTEGKWTVRDTICHLAGYYPATQVPVQIERLHRLVEEGARGRDEFDIDTANEAILRGFDGVDIEEVFDVVLAGRAALRTAIDQLDESFLERPVSGTIWGTNATVHTVVAESTSRHDAGHLDEIVEAVMDFDPVLVYQYLQP
ncbi:hypothetical protein [Nocardia arizonensis]|uniref:hypothetical protein n=1 Tax=Nocardia arizonensis TaxID=1141647 RepID=UPI0006D17964|nr:hypothetical protein [Nocardia arizonensis]